MITYEVEYRNKYNVEWRVTMSVKPFETKADADKLVFERSLSKSPDIVYRIVRVTREVME